MKRRAFLGALGAAACSASAPARPFVRSVLAVARNAGEASPTEEHFSLGELERFRQLAELELHHTSPLAMGSVLSTLLFDRLGFAREVDDPSLDFVLLPTVLRRRRGSCVGLGVLFLALAEALRQRASGVLMPGHFFVRLEQVDGSHNVELLRRGEQMPDAWYGQRFPIPSTEAASQHPVGWTSEYARPLTFDETLGVIEYDVGSERRRQQRLVEARSAYQRAIRSFPGFAEAHASLGATLQLLGKLDDAEASYERARAINPELAGVAWNRALLAHERASKPAPP
jgi:tetratricopeptide (TPR) repeat protein